jgi:hypothetical protein
MPLNAYDIRILAEFARFVDKENIARVRVKNALTLDEVVLIAHFYGFRDISVELFIKATNLLVSTDWIWKKYGKRWIDHIFMLSLMMLTQDKIREPEEVQLLDTNEAASEVVNTENEAIAFYEYAKLTKDIQEELICSKTLDEVVEAARSHGFMVRKVDFLMNKHEWKDNFFPWGKMSTQETREFMHACPPHPHRNTAFSIKYNSRSKHISADAHIPRNDADHLTLTMKISANSYQYYLASTFGRARMTATIGHN